MPNRIIRENILTSEPVCSLNWADEVFYRRLLSVVDDYGRHEANAQLLRSRCYPLQTDVVRVADITRSMAACQKAGLIVLYEGNGKQLLQVLKFGQQTRSPSKHPPPSDSACDQLIAIDIKRNHSLTNAHLDVVVVVDENVVEIGVSRFDEFWTLWPANERKQDRKKCREKWLATKLDRLADRILADVALRKQGTKWADPQFIEAPLVYLNNERWQDDFTPSKPLPTAEARKPWN